MEELLPGFDKIVTLPLYILQAKIIGNHVIRLQSRLKVDLPLERGIFLSVLTGIATGFTSWVRSVGDDGYSIYVDSDLECVPKNIEAEVAIAETAFVGLQPTMAIDGQSIALKSVSINGSSAFIQRYATVERNGRVVIEATVQEGAAELLEIADIQSSQGTLFDLSKTSCHRPSTAGVQALTDSTIEKVGSWSICRITIHAQDNIVGVRLTVFYPFLDDQGQPSEAIILKSIRVYRPPLPSLTKGLAVDLAVLITGQFRSIDMLDETWNLIIDKDPKVFISTWKKRGAKLGGWISSYQLIRILGDDIGYAYPTEWDGDAQELFGRIPGLYQAIVEFISRKPEVDVRNLARFKAIEIDIEDEELYSPADVLHSYTTNCEILLYKIYRCIKSMIKYEKVTGKQFSHVLRVRPDLHWKGDLKYLLTDGAFFDFVDKGNSDSRLDLRLGDNFVLSPRDYFIDLFKKSLNEARRYKLAENKEWDIHSLLGKIHSEANLEANASPAGMLADEWPRQEFIGLFKRLVETTSVDDVTLAFFANMQAGLALTEGLYAEAQHYLDRVPISQKSKNQTLFTQARLYQAIGQPDFATKTALLLTEDIYLSHLHRVGVRITPK